MCITLAGHQDTHVESAGSSGRAGQLSHGVDVSAVLKSVLVVGDQIKTLELLVACERQMPTEASGAVAGRITGVTYPGTTCTFTRAHIVPADVKPLSTTNSWFVPADV